MVIKMKWKCEQIFRKIEQLLFHPEIIMNRLHWKICGRRLEGLGINSRVGIGFSILGEKYIEIGENFLGGKNLQLDAWTNYNGQETGIIPELRIGNQVTITDNCYISCAEKIEIGDGVLFGTGVFVCDNLHGKNRFDELEIPPSKRILWRKGAVRIGKNVWLGRNVCVMPGVTIGDYAIIGANAVVTHDIPQYTIAGGVPAKIIRTIDAEDVNSIDLQTVFNESQYQGGVRA